MRNGRSAVKEQVPLSTPEERAEQGPRSQEPPEQTSADEAQQEQDRQMDEGTESPG